MKKFTLTLFLAFVAIFFIACGGKEMSAMDKRIAEKITFIDTDKKVVKAFNYRFNSNYLLEFELVILEDDDEDYEYKVAWKDEDGFVLKAPTDGEYISFKVKEKQEHLVQRVATDKRAVDFSLIVRKK